MERRKFIKVSLSTAALATMPSGAGKLFPINVFGQEHLQIETGWKLVSEFNCSDTGDVVSQTGYDDSKWYTVKKLPRTIVAVLEDNGVYHDLYYGKDLSTVPELYKQEWWYRKELTIPSDDKQYWLKFLGISYRGELWINGKQVANNRTMVGTYSTFEFNLTSYVKADRNAIALKIRPDQTDAGHLELGTFWVDWIGSAKVPDRNGGIWQPVFLRSTGAVEIRNSAVNTDLPLPHTSPARLTVYCNLVNGSGKKQNGTLHGTISRPRKTNIFFQREITLEANQSMEARITPDDCHQLSVSNPDLWWPYTLGQPNLYKLKLEFKTGGTLSDTSTINFGIRKVERGRDPANDNYLYLKINGQNYLVRGGCYTPDLFFKQNDARDRTMVKYIKDLGINFIRLEGKMGDPYFYDLCDREGIPIMTGWCCCGQWESWNKWDDEDRRVALQGVQSQALALRSHACAFVWANGSDGVPPDDILSNYHQVLKREHWQNAIVDHCAGNTDGIQMLGPYATRPPYYWFASSFKANRGFTAEQGSNEIVVPYETLKKFIPSNHLWPMDDYWYYHCGNNGNNRHLTDIRNFVEHGFGSCANAEEFCDRAQIFQYADARAQFEAFAARGWETCKGIIYWMFGTHWPSFFGQIIDYYLKLGGTYFGVKNGLRPLNVAYDYYGDGDRSRAKIYVYNQTLNTYENCKVRVRIINLDNDVKYDSGDVALSAVTPLSTRVVHTIGKVDGLDAVWFVKCELKDASGKLMLDNIYWQSSTNNVLLNEDLFRTDQSSWGDYKALKKLPQVALNSSANIEKPGHKETVKVSLTNNSAVIAFFTRVEITKGDDGEEVVPVTYTDNYITLFPGETKVIAATYDKTDLDGQRVFLRIKGFNATKTVNQL